MPKLRSGFSLVELSIVLVILGLLTGGILGGQSLIEAAELRAISTEYDAWQTATNVFVDKYMEIPGDMRMADEFWPGVVSGNGNGRISIPSGANQTGDSFTFWQHLAKAGLIAGEYTGVAGGDSNMHSMLGVNVPKSKYSNAGWTARHCYTGDDCGNGTADYEVPYGNHFTFGSAVDYDTDQPVLTPEEAWNVDTKLDDGQPAKGKVIALFWNDACAAADDGSSSVTDLEASYRLSDGSVECALVFRDSI